MPTGSVTVMLAAAPSVAAPSVHAKLNVSPVSGSVPEPTRVTLAPAGDVASTLAGPEAVALGGRLLDRRTAKGESEGAIPQIREGPRVEVISTHWPFWK